MKLIPLTQGLFAMVDDADYEAVSQFKWHAKKMRHAFYAARNIRKSDGRRTTQLLHQFLFPGVEQTDHRDGNGLNNQRENLRPATDLQNRQGFRRKKSGTTSLLRGVTWDRKSQKWRSQIQADGKKIHLGVFESEKSAARAYDAAAIKYFLDFSAPNFL